MVLVVDPARLEVPVTYEAPEAGAEEFPHVYGPIPVNAVTWVEPWRWAVAVWLALVATAGGLTLWWQDPEEPQRPAWEKSGPTPSLPEGWETACAHATPDENGRALCFIRTR